MLGLCLLVEWEFVVKFGVLCFFLCEVLIVLEIDGCVEIWGGFGVYVCVLLVGGESVILLFGDSLVELM